MKFVWICAKKVVFVSLFLIGCCIAIHGYGLLPEGRVICDFNRELHEGGVYLLTGFGVMSLGAFRWLFQKENLLILIASVAILFIYFLCK